MNISAGDVYTLYWEHPDQSGRGSDRLGVVVQVVGELLLTLPTTTKYDSTKVAHRKFRVPIRKWAEAGFKQKTYVKADPSALLPATAVRRRIGSLDVDDLNNIIIRMNEISKLRNR